MAELLYDPDCGFCTRSARVGARLRLATLIAPLRYDDDRIDASRALEEIPFVADDGSVTYGAEAIAAALRTGPIWCRLAGRLIDNPVTVPLSRRIYRLVARHRHQLPGGSAACALPDTNAEQ